MSHRKVYIALPADIETGTGEIGRAIVAAMQGHTDQWDWWDRDQITDNDERTFARLAEIPFADRDYDAFIDLHGDWWSGFMLRPDMVDRLPPDTWIAAVDSHF